MEALSYTNRYEIKYLVPAHRMPAIRKSLEEFLTRDRNGFHDGGYYCHSIYFDSPDHYFYQEKREGDLVRIKPRIRSYRASPDTPPATLFLELKGRYDRIIAKRRSPISRETADRLLTHVPSGFESETLATSALGMPMRSGRFSVVSL